MPGAEGGAALLAALERGPLTRCALLPLPAQGGFLAAYAGVAPAVASCTTFSEDAAWLAMPFDVLHSYAHPAWPTI